MFFYFYLMVLEFVCGGPIGGCFLVPSFLLVVDNSPPSRRFAFLAFYFLVLNFKNDNLNKYSYFLYYTLP